MISSNPDKRSGVPIIVNAHSAIKWEQRLNLRNVFQFNFTLTRNAPGFHGFVFFLLIGHDLALHHHC